MKTVFLILAAVVITFITSMVAMLLVGVILVIISGVCVKIVTGELPQSLGSSYPRLDFLFKTLCYTAADFAGLAAGYAILSAGDMVRFFPIVIAVIVFSCFLHQSRSKGRAGRVEVPLTKLDKIANVIGTIVSIVLGYLLLYR